MGKIAWNTAKYELKKIGFEINTRRKSCELGCSCVEDAWDAKAEGKPNLWQTGKRFSSDWGGYLNHSNLTDAHKWQLMGILNTLGVKFEWDGNDNHSIFIDLDPEK